MIAEMFAPCEVLAGNLEDTLQLCFTAEETAGRGEEEKLLGTASFVQPLGTSALYVDSEELPANYKRAIDELEAFAVLPGIFDLDVPSNAVPGQTLNLHGPHGTIQVLAPDSPYLGTKGKYRLGPPPEYVAQVPPNHKYGDKVMHRREDGQEVSFTVPAGLKPGDMFEVTAPAMMVQVPDGAEDGNVLVFRGAGNRTSECGADDCGADDSPRAEFFLRTQVPKGVQPGRYFAARLPPPKPDSF